MPAARQRLASSDLHLDVTSLAGLSTQALEARLRTLPPQSMVLYLTVDRIGPDQNFRPLDYLERVSAVANAPVYSWVDSALGHGIVGGSLKSQEEEFRALGELALRVLRGESPDSIPVSSPDLDVKLADWREMQRWGLSASRLPAGTQVRFREPSVWNQYKVYIVAIVAGLLAQTALISALLIQRRQRRHAERQVLRNQSALRSSYEEIRDLGGRLLTAQDAERARIARELHDDIGQQLVLLDIELQGLRTHPDAGVAEALALAKQRIATIQRSTHDLSHRLHPAKLRLIGLVASIEGLQRDFSHSGTAITFDKTLVQDTFPADLSVCLFRVVQEALQNAVKHGGARTVAIALDTTNELSLRIDDDGAGFDVDGAWNRGLGLISMRERVEALGGTIDIHSRRTGGTRIEVQMPLSAMGAPASLAG
jgi:signal transduction histidine kinase